MMTMLHCSKRCNILLLQLLAVLLIWSGAVHGEVLRISGSTSLAPAISQLANDFSRQHEGITVSIRAEGSGQGMRDLMSGQADIAMSSRFITREEYSMASSLSGYPVPFAVAHDSVIPVVHPVTGPKSLELAQIRDIFSGKIKRWSAVGELDFPIQVICRDVKSGTHDTWNSQLLGGAPDSGCKQRMASNLDVVKAVRSQPGTIGYVSLSFLTANARVKPLAIAGSTTNSPISRTLFLFTRGWPNPRLLKFIRYVQHPDKGQRTLAAFGLTPLD